MEEVEIKDLEIVIAERNKAQNLSVPEVRDSNTNEQAGELVGQAFQAAIVAEVKTNTDTQGKLVGAAKKVIDSKVEKVVNEAEKEEKAAYFDNNADACAIFCVSEKTTSKSTIYVMKGYKYILDMIFTWTIGMFLIAPIMFFAYKIKAGMKSMWWAVLLGILVYILIVLTPILIRVISGLGST